MHSNAKPSQLLTAVMTVYYIVGLQHIVRPRFMFTRKCKPTSTNRSLDMYIPATLQTYLSQPAMSTVCFYHRQLSKGTHRKAKKLRQVRLTKSSRGVRGLGECRGIILHMRTGGWIQQQYAYALFIIDGLGHAVWSSTMPVSQFQTVLF